MFGDEAMGKVLSIGFGRGGAGASTLTLFSSCILAQKSKVLVIAILYDRKNIIL